MENEFLKRWNDVYGNEAYAYGQNPNEFLKEQLANLSPGKILFPAEGEGRNGVYAAELGWEVSAFDISEKGKNKALNLAKAKQVEMDYRVGELAELGFAPASFDAIALIYAHFPPEIKSAYHQALGKLLKKGGIIIFEAFSKSHLKYRAENPKVGGPGQIDFLASMAEIKADFSDFEIIELEEKVVELSEGLYHNGKGAVIRFVGRKK
ncbi:SAM-dependent methyltransferase [Putridiphycobacter roseus]|uniref:SAM-dependent methyltransferase n=1 Tax=Putridiphycobacter roseus TaxID=2219161 RepID=A0A2W1NRC4_9FLAO|nr:class I SAM-dependent methyltransferase [Putridiphycobacter roseus]PZE18162.1 SAM-dependent methyltransferase [Putridiphycobacter roseus]